MYDTYLRLKVKVAAARFALNTLQEDLDEFDEEREIIEAAIVILEQIDFKATARRLHLVRSATQESSQ